MGMKVRGIHKLPLSYIDRGQLLCGRLAPMQETRMRMNETQHKIDDEMKTAHVVHVPPGALI